MRILFLLLMIVLTNIVGYSSAPKHEFRGAWIQTIFQGYNNRSTAQNKAYLTKLIDDLHQSGINAIIFQVRPRSDAFYKSDIEPWSGFLTGTIGKAPTPQWDPLQFVINEAHKRGIELHAWLNPYRAPLISEVESLPSNHLLRTNPERFVAYGKGFYFEPSQQVNRDYICKIVADIVERYDVDGIHFDDYFYPYPIPNQEFPDSIAYAEANTNLSLGDWRRQNIDKLIKQVSETINSIKPWVRFGISPFGIWRNSTSDPKGSKTSGLQNYDDLYADVPKWAKNGWIDYQIPQLYWELEHKNAPYAELAEWWANNPQGRHIYIGQDVEKTVKFNELNAKMFMSQNSNGNCWWYAASFSLVAKELSATFYKYKALVPEYIWKNALPAEKPYDVSYSNGIMSWQSCENAHKWVIYRFNSSDEINIDNPAAICAVTYYAIYKPAQSGIYIITSIDHTNGESAPSDPVSIKL